MSRMVFKTIPGEVLEWCDHCDSQNGVPWWVIRQGGSCFSWGTIPSQESQFLCGVCCHHREKKHRGDLIWGGVQTQDYVLNTNLSSIHSTIPHPFSLNHSVVAWFAHLHHLGFQPTLPNLGKCLWWQRWCGASLGGGQSNTLKLTLRLFCFIYTTRDKLWGLYDTKTNYVNGGGAFNPFGGIVFLNQSAWGIFGRRIFPLRLPQDVFNLFIKLTKKMILLYYPLCVVKTRLVYMGQWCQTQRPLQLAVANNIWIEQ